MSAITRRYVAALVAMVVTAAAVEGIHTISEAPAAYEPRFEQLSLGIADYKGEELEVDESIFHFLGADAMIERLYSGADGWVSVTLIYGAHWRNVHSPTGCYPAQGWLIVTDEPIEVPGPANSPTEGPIQARLLRVTKNEEQRLAMFAFCHPGGTTSDWTWQAVKVMFGQLFTQRGAGGVIIILNTAPTPSPAAGAERMKQFLAEIYPYAVGFWYEEPATGRSEVRHDPVLSTMEH